jgi:hypothetical protein
MKKSKSIQPGGPFTGSTHDRRVLGRAQDEGVDDPYKLRRELHEPTRCPRCGAVYHEGRWQWNGAATRKGPRGALPGLSSHQ